MFIIIKTFLTKKQHVTDRRQRIVNKKSDYIKVTYCTVSKKCLQHNILTGCGGRSQTGEDNDPLIPSSGISHSFI